MPASEKCAALIKAVCIFSHKLSELTQLTDFVLLDHFYQFKVQHANLLSLISDNQIAVFNRIS